MSNVSPETRTIWPIPILLHVCWSSLPWFHEFPLKQPDSGRRSITRSPGTLILIWFWWQEYLLSLSCRLSHWYGTWFRASWVRRDKLLQYQESDIPGRQTRSSQVACRTCQYHQMRPSNQSVPLLIDLICEYSKTTSGVNLFLGREPRKAPWHHVYWHTAHWWYSTCAPSPNCVIISPASGPFHTIKMAWKPLILSNIYNALRNLKRDSDW